MNRLTQVVLAIALASFASVSNAQQDEWRITPYAWIAGFDGTVGVVRYRLGLPGRVDVDTDGFSDNLRLGGAMLHVGWRRGRWAAFGDWTYADAKTDAPTPFTTLYAGVDVKVKGNIVEAYGAYDLFGTPGNHFDIYGGVRYYNLKVAARSARGGVAGRAADARKATGSTVSSACGGTRASPATGKRSPAPTSGAVART